MRHRPLPTIDEVYFLEDATIGLVKIGFSRDAYLRHQTIERQLGRRLELLGVLTGGRLEERRLHKRFARYRKHGEWFVLTDEIREFATAHTRPHASSSPVMAAPSTPLVPMGISLDPGVHEECARLSRACGIEISALVRLMIEAGAAPVAARFAPRARTAAP